MSDDQTVAAELEVLKAEADHTRALAELALAKAEVWTNVAALVEQAVGGARDAVLGLLAKKGGGE